MPRIPWTKTLRKKTDPEPPLRPPIPLGPMSNGEFYHPDTKRKRLMRKLIIQKADENARRLGIDRREFLASAMGVCTSLYVINAVSGCSSGDSGSSDPDIFGEGMGGGGSGSGGGGGGVNVPAESMMEEELAECVIGPVSERPGGDFIVDMQSHFINPEGQFLSNEAVSAGFVAYISSWSSREDWAEFLPGCEGINCYDRQSFVDHFFLDSDTTVGVLSGIPYTQCGPQLTTNCDIAPLTNKDIDDAKKWAEGLVPGRVLSHALVMPNDRIEDQLLAMEENASWGVNAWKTYPPWGSGRSEGYWLDDEVGLRMIEKGREVGVKVFCVHKGFPLSNFSTTYTNPREMGIVAKMFPDVTFVTYHSAIEHGLPNNALGTLDTEGPYDPDGMWDPANPTKYPIDMGVNSLITSVLDNGIVPNDPSVKLYAELGGAWPSVISRPTEAAHMLGKLLQYLGEDRIVWGTDCLWIGSPRPVIEAFRAFQIPVEMQEKYGYPALTSERKAKILGLNAARIHNLSPCVEDYPQLQALRRAIDGEVGPRRYMMMRTPAPTSRRAFLRLREHEGHERDAYSGFSFLRGRKIETNLRGRRRG